MSQGHAQGALSILPSQRTNGEVQQLCVGFQHPSFFLHMYLFNRKFQLLLDQNNARHVTSLARQ